MYPAPLMKRISVLSSVLLALLNPSLQAATFTVTNTSDSGPGSLRQAISDAAGAAGPDVINFAAVISGQTITLATQLNIADPGGLTIDATANAGGITVSGNDQVRVIFVNSSGTVTLRGLTVARGRADYGAGCATAGTGLTQLEQCTVQGNTATNGSGGLDVDVNARLTLLNCTVTQNSANFGGAVAMNNNTSTLVLRHCTVTGNTGTLCCGGVIARGTVTVDSCIIAGNTGSAGSDINLETANFTRQGINLIGNHTSVEAIFPAGLPNANGDFAGSGAALLSAKLGPLQDNGGPSRTMQPLADSAARDRIATPGLTTDQRGLPRGMWGKSDIGAVEAGVTWNSGWEVRDVTRTPATLLNTLTDAETLAASPTATSVIAPREVINFSDPQLPGGAGFFNGDTPFVSDTGVDNEDFVTVARTFIRIPQGPAVTANRIVVTSLNPGGENNWHLAEIQVFQSGTSTNVAAASAGAVASGPAGYGTVPADVNDGNTDGIQANGSLWHSPGTAPGEAITVTFSAAVSVDTFRLWGRTECCLERDDLIRVEFFNGASLVSSQITGIVTGTNTTGTARVQDYTLGFRSDDGARLRLYRTDGGLPPQFSSSTRLNTGNPANPAHSGNTLSFPAITGNSDTLGVVALGAGVYGVEFFYWERNGGANAEVFAAAGAKTAVDGDFRLLGDGLSGPRGLGAPGPWEVTVIRNGATTLAAAVSQMTTYWCDPPVVTGLRFTSANDAPERDPMTFQLEGTNGTAAAGPWTVIATGNTGLATTRLTASPVAAVTNTTAWKSYRLTFPTVRNAGAANSMQIGEVEFLNAAGLDVVSPGDALIPSSVNSPSNEGPANAIDNDPGTKYLNFDELNTGFTVTPNTGGLNNATTASVAVLNLTDPQAGGGGHGQTQTNFPGDSAADDNNFATGARSTISVPAEGYYTFCVLGDDGVRVRIPGSRGWTVSGGALPVPLLDGFLTDGCCADAFGQVFLKQGTHPIEVIRHEGGGASYLGLWAAPGQWSSLEAQAGRAFTLVGTASTGTIAGFSHALQPGAATPPVNDNFAAALPLSGAPVSTTGHNGGATLESGEPVTADLNASVWWTWTAPASGTVSVTTAGSDFDTVLSVHTGATVNNLTLVTEDDDGGPGNTSGAGFSAVAGTVYRVRAGGYGANRGTIRLSLSFLANDAFSTATNLGSGSRIFVTGDNTGASAQAGEPQHHAESDAASGSVWFTWTPAVSGDYIIDTVGSQFDTVLAVYSGTAVNSLTPLASDDDSGDTGPNESLLMLTATAGVTYRIAVDGYGSGDRGRLVLNITPRPVITAIAARSGPVNTLMVTLRWRSEEGLTYRIQSSPNLTTWSQVADCTASEGTETDLDIEGIPYGTTRLYFRVQRL